MKKYASYIMKFIFRVRYNTDEFKKFRAYITNFYDNYDPEYSFNRYRITKVRLYNLPKEINVEIHSLSPGMVIGVRGQTIDRFKEFLQKRYSKPVKITLEESNPFK